ncbi:MAG TPA: hypothetical protein VLJ58_00295, partial [Ramlibacter sp.]|nr:hypothetical protein [Ramlibacter sp.]
FDPMLPRESMADGKFDPRAALADALRPPSRAFSAVADEMLALQRWRDAESALIAACRSAALAADTAGVPQANAQMKLGQLYADFARQPQGHAPAAALLARAQVLVAGSAAIYERVLGRQASRTRVAQQRLQALMHPQAPAPAPEVAGLVDGVLDDSELAATTNAMGAPAAVSLALSLALQSPDVAQADSDLARLQEQARGVARDPQGFEQRLHAAQAQKQACPDEACVRQWYARRRQQVLREF